MVRRYLRRDPELAPLQVTVGNDRVTSPTFSPSSHAPPGSRHPTLPLRHPVSTCPCRPSAAVETLLGPVASKTMPQRLEAVRAGGTLMKYNQRDGKSAPRWVKIWGDKICWGDVRTKECKSQLLLPEATAILHGAKCAAAIIQ